MAWLLAALVAFGGLQVLRVHSLKAKAAQAELVQATQHAVASEQAREAEQQMGQKARKAADDYSRQAATVRRDADGLRVELDRLRDTLTAAGPAPEAAAAACRADDAGRARVVVGECAGALSAVAVDAAACAEKLTALQNYVRAIGAGN